MYDPVANQWTQLANVPGPARGYAVGFALGGKGYIGGGISGCGGIGLNDFYSYNPSTGKWDTIAPCPAKGCGQQAVAFAIGNYGYVGTGDSVGSTSVPQKDFWRYDPSSNTWTRMADFGGGVRGGASGFATCDKGYIGLGYNNSSQSVVENDFWQYDPVKNSWTQIANFGGVARQVAPSFVINKSCFVTLGVAGNNATQTDIWEYIQSVTPGFSADATICTGQPVTFTDTSDYSPTNWFWNFEGGTPDTSSSSSPVITYNTAGTFDVTLTAWNGCDSATKTFTQYITVTTFPGTIHVFPVNAVACNGESLTLKATGGITYQWVGTTDTTESISIHPTQDTTYELMVSNGSCVKDTSITVKVNSPAPLVIQPQFPSVCNGAPTLLSVPASGSNYTWSPSTGLNKTTGDSVTIINPTITTTYYVTGLDSVGCAVSDSDIITVIPSPNKPTFAQHGDTLISSSNYDDQWYFDGQLLTGDTSQHLVITDTGEYWVTVNNEVNGCSTASDSVDITTVTGIEQLAVESGQLIVYPNPFNSEVFIKINSSAEDVKGWTMLLTDVLGRTLYSISPLNPPPMSSEYMPGTFELDLSNLSSGMYFITIINKTGRAVLPVVKQ
jgi:PKD repeat protein